MKDPFWLVITAAMAGNYFITDLWWKVAIVVPLLCLASMLYGYQRGRKCERT
jgi:hypothetical protein